MHKIKFKHFLFPILPQLAPLMCLFSFCASCNLAVPFPVDCSVKFHPFSNNKHNNFQFLSAYWCILLIHLDSVHFGNWLVINVWWQCFLWKMCRLSKLEIDFGVLFFRTCLMAYCLVDTKPLSAGILLIGHLGTNFSEILIEIYTFSFKKIHLKMPSAKWQPFYLLLNVLNLGAL